MTDIPVTDPRPTPGPASSQPRRDAETRATQIAVRRRTLGLTLAGGAASVGAGMALARHSSDKGTASSRRVLTSFGSVMVIGSSRIDTARADHKDHTSHSSALRGPGSADVPVSSAVHGAWTSGVIVAVEVRNHSREAVQMSPGQFRVRVGENGPTVSLYSSDREAAPLDPGTARTLRITYLAPASDSRLSLDFADIGSSRSVGLGSVGGRRIARG